MPILWCGGEDIDFPTFTGCSVVTTSGHFRSGYARAAIRGSSGSAAKSSVFPGGAITSGWLSFMVYPTSLNLSIRLCGLGNSSTAKSGLYVGNDSSTAAKVALIKYDGTTATTLATESGTSLSASTIHKIDMHLTSYGASASVDVYVDGSLVISYTGNVSVSGVSNVDSVFIGSISTSTNADISEIIVADSDTRNMSLVTNYLNAVGDSNAWTGAYTDIDEAAINDADLIYDNTDGHQALFGLHELPSGNFSVLAVKEAIRACKSSDSTPTSINLGVKSGGTVNVSDNHSLSTSWDTKERYMLTNPVTGNPFTASEVDSLQLALEAAA